MLLEKNVRLLSPVLISVQLLSPFQGLNQREALCAALPMECLGL